MRSPMRSLTALAVTLCTLILVALAPLNAQATAHSTTNCRVWEPHPDNPVDYAHSFTQPAIAWDVEYAATSVALAAVLTRFTPLSPMWAAAIPSVGFGLGPHLLGHAQGRYPVSLHWAFVAADRALPVALAVHDSARTTAVVTWAVLTTGLLCFDR